MKQFETLLVEQQAIRHVECVRAISIEVPKGCRDRHWIQRLIAEGDLDFGPFPFEPIEGSESIEIISTDVVERAGGSPDLPFVERTES